MRKSIDNAEFIKGIKAFDDCPDVNLPEIAFIGRSNAGKSSLINKLTKRKNLAHTSSKPGKTTEINFFSANFKTDKVNNPIIISDLPGFGYAKFSKFERESLSGLTVQYLSEREQLSLVFLVHDSKRLKIGPEERALQELLFNNNVYLAIIVSKCDRLKQKELHSNLREIAKAYGLEKNDLIIQGNNTNIDSIISRIENLIF